ncbi:AbrB/MazE/SpoVT family DNA-binding domain-containing protein [Azospirillum sp.]|uniref:AbrB/MazE/SpoVT family DNA-binding domain-containing protein n=1 Tax=Azospirillum sp. TaxID=34012 RepID=UPI002D640C68|nr:AbrB/MazE/SpoVT family DNA-binding domain-containing protein [Azospirillum sp.]HYD67478.1 AbrB/MazE/SpoVT family DNA-binding domain-containing protein [Azospirillum sp.]
MSIELTVTAKGQITLRQAVLDHLGIAPGDRVSVSLRPDGRAELRPLRAKPEVIASRGVLKRPGRRPVSIEEMQAAIEEGAAGDDA